MPNHIIGLGCKARNGKDTVASIWKGLEENVHIIHFADALYEEVKNHERRFPLITRIYRNEMYWYLLNDEREIKEFSQREMPKIHKIFNDRGIEQYWGMDEKDPEILQFWGTEFRREKCGNDYWVKQVHKKIREIINQESPGLATTDTKHTFFLIPDTRFKNEQEFIKKEFFNRGVFVKVERYNPDGTQYLDPSRDPKHPSETDLDDVTPDYLIKANSGDFETLTKETESLINIIKNGFFISESAEVLIDKQESWDRSL